MKSEKRQRKVKNCLEILEVNDTNSKLSRGISIGLKFSSLFFSFSLLFNEQVICENTVRYPAHIKYLVFLGMAFNG